MNKDILVATRYAQAFFDVVSLTHQDELVEAELEAFSQALKKAPEIEQFLNNPKLLTADKRQMLFKIYQERKQEIYEIFVNFFTLLFEKNRFYLIHEISTEFKRIADEAQGQGVAEIKSAAPLDPKSEAAIVSQLEKIAGYKIRIKKEVDPKLIGGVVVRVRHHVIDGSIRSQLDNLKKELTKIGTI